MGDKESKYPKTTLGELDSSLPIGWYANEKRGGLVPRRWNLNREKQLAILQKEHSSPNFISFIPTLLGLMYEEIGPYTIDEGLPLNKGRRSEWRKILSQINTMYMPDVMYAYIYLRVNSIGDSIKLLPRCQACGKEHPFTGDLHTLDVLTVPDLEVSKTEFKLLEPIKVRDKECHTLKMGIPRWHVFASQVSDSFDEATFKEALIAGSITGMVFEDGSSDNAAPSLAELGELGKRDFEELIIHIGEDMPGVDMSIDLTCTDHTCGHVSKIPLNWMYEGFFGVSGR